MKLPHIYTISHGTLSKIEKRMMHAERKHGAHVDNAHCMGALHLEVEEVTRAMQARDDRQVYEELLDVATVAIRRAQALCAGMEDSD